MKGTRKLNWAYLPAGLVFTTAVWLRSGPAAAFLTVVLGFAMAYFAEQKAKRRQSDD
jgi:hypothetical protein